MVDIMGRTDFDERWRGVEPHGGLTWGAILEGRRFFEAARLDFSRVSSILEIGPGYGRLLSALREAGYKGKYTGLDISPGKVEELAGRLGDNETAFVAGDCRSAKFAAPFDALISSSTMEHIHPDFGAMLANMVPQLTPKAQIALDFIDEGNDNDRQGSDRSGVFIRQYSRAALRSVCAWHGVEVLSIEPYVMASVANLLPIRREGCLSRAGDGRVALVHRLMLKCLAP